MMRLMFAITLLLVVADVAVVAGPPRRSRRQAAQYQPATNWVPVEQTEQPVTTVVSSSETKPTTTTATTGSDDALEEVNAERSRRGLRAFLPDPLLNKAARECARQRATRGIHGHLPESDFTYVPSGGQASSAGCGALEPSWGWGTCCTYDDYTYAGAAWVMGNDGRRYMHLFVR
jgi:hypothetical protein